MPRYVEQKRRYIMEGQWLEAKLLAFLQAGDVVTLRKLAPGRDLDAAVWLRDGGGWQTLKRDDPASASFYQTYVDTDWPLIVIQTGKTDPLARRYARDCPVVLLPFREIDRGLIDTGAPIVVVYQHPESSGDSAGWDKLSAGKLCIHDERLLGLVDPIVDSRLSNPKLLSQLPGTNQVWGYHSYAEAYLGNVAKVAEETKAGDSQELDEELGRAVDAFIEARKAKISARTPILRESNDAAFHAAGIERVRGIFMNMLEESEHDFQSGAAVMMRAAVPGWEPPVRQNLSRSVEESPPSA